MGVILQPVAMQLHNKTGKGNNMKYLIDAKSIVTMKGTKLTAKQDESVYADGKDTLAIASMKSIANVNGFKVTGKSTKDVKKSFDENLSKLDIARVSTMKISDEVLEIVKDANEDGTSENVVLISIVNSGIKFQSAVTMLKKARIDLGLDLSDKDRKKQSIEIMEDDDFEPETYADVAKMAKQIVEDVANTTEAQALTQIRMFCKDNEITVPTKPKGTAGVQFPVKAFAWMASNMEADADTLEEWLEEQGKNEKVIEGFIKKFAQFKTEMKELAPAKAPAKKGGKKK